MIGRLSGSLLSKNPPEVLLDVQGVGYELEVPMSTYYELPAAGQAVVLVVHMVVREDAQLLYGFGTTAERALFRALLRVNGVGAKVALAILSGMSVEEFSLCIERDDVSALIRMPGIGKKTAERLVIELRDKLANLPVGLAPPSSNTGSLDLGDAGPQPGTDIRSQAIEALVALGYKPAEATKMVDKARPVVESASDSSSDITVENVIRAALKSMTARA